ncbi:hypothetical protein [Hyphomonas adhaerens]|uniref:hypothetical protein n=1 Tax=Hyphomonas adhaerens TaxID=81029 RepID=UPI0023573DBC|nr:hypothetical protein [Hyphomonas adhaerens]
MSFLHPPSGFPPHLAVIWSLIWGQLLLLRAAVRAVYGKGVQYHWSVSPYGRVFLTSVDWIPSQKADRAWLKPRLHASDRVAAACDGRLLTPAWLQCLVRPGRGRGGADAWAPSILTPAPCSRPAAGLLPLPET